MRGLAAALLVVATTAASAAEVDGSPPAARSELDLTIYANGLALVADRRPATLAAGANRLVFPDVSGQLIPESAIVSGEGVTVNTLDYDFATLSADALLRRNVGREVGVVRVDPSNGEETIERATILSADPGVVLRYRDRIETEVPGRLVFDQVPDDLPATPTLTAGIHADAASQGGVDLVYLTTGLAWQADYVAVVDADAGRIDLHGRAIVSNTSGTAFTNARLGLVAGDVRRVSAAPQPRMRAEMSAMAADATPAPEPLGAFYLYRVPGSVSLADRQSRQFALLSLEDLPLEQRYVSDGTGQIFAPRMSEPTVTHPTVALRFVNPPAETRGVPLPAGIVRLFADDAGTLRLLGEDRIADTPTGATAVLEAGRAFDITVTRAQTDFSRADLPEQTFESAWRIEVANAKDRSVSVDVVEPLAGDWEILGESASHAKTRADQATWTLAVPARGRTVLEYRVRVRQ